MWDRLQERYDASNTATRVQLQAGLQRIGDRSESVQEYLENLESIFNRLAAMESAISEDLQVAKFFSTFCH